MFKVKEKSTKVNSALRHRLLLATAVGAVAPLSAHAAKQEAKQENCATAAIAPCEKLKPIIDLRYRTELVDDDNFDNPARAHTLRGRFGVLAKPNSVLELVVEGEGVVNLNDNFNSTTNGVTNRPVVADPEEIELNRARATITVSENAKLTVGRQRINFADQRFVGAVDFRQNQQTYDAVRLRVKPAKNVEVDYAYVDRVHRIFGDDNPSGNFRSNSHIGEVRMKSPTFGDVAVYGFALDFENAPALSTRTIGARAKKKIDVSENVTAIARVEFANQTDHGDNPNEFDVNYVGGDITLKRKGIAFKAGYERLGGDGTVGFSTPLATLHKFQGFADRFLATPADGLQDIYGMASWSTGPVGPFKGAAVKFFAHRFDSVRNDRDFGSELDLIVNLKINTHLAAQFRGAVYMAGEDGPRSVTKTWFSLRYQL